MLETAGCHIPFTAVIVSKSTNKLGADQSDKEGHGYVSQHLQ